MIPTSQVERLMGSALAGEGAYALARGLVDEVGPRLAGSPGDARAVAWALAAMRKAGLQSVRAEPVRVPRWERGPISEEEGAVVAPVSRPLSLTALGGSVGSAGLEAELVEAGSFEELKALGEPAVRGRVVLWNVVMRRGADGMANYAEVAKFRGSGAIEAARLGAVGVLVRSLGVANYRLPHTGAMRYQDGVPRIPAAAVAAEDAELLHRLLQAGGPGAVKVRLRLPCRQLPDADSANVVGELRGRSDELVLLGAHLDSWDLGHGAIDDAAGVAVVLGAARALAALPPARRTLRVVLFANEENGLRGAKAYAAAHEAEVSRHVAALEIDSGAGRPLGFAIKGAPAMPLMQALVRPLRGIGADRLFDKDYGGADLTPLEGRVAVLGMQQDTSRYFEWHHTAADTLDKIDPTELNLATAATAVVARGLLEARDTLPRPVPGGAERP